MKKLYITIGIAALAVLSAYTLYACNNTGTTVAADEQPVDLSTSAASSADSESHDGPISVADFDKMIKGDKLTMVDFYTTWCGPCKRMAPSVRKIQSENADIVNVLQIDAEAQMDIAARYRLEGYPTVIFFKKGQIVANLLGLHSYEQLMEQVNKLK